MQLEDTIPSDRRRQPGLIPGFTGENQLYTIPDRIVADGGYVINPQFEFLSEIDCAFAVQFNADAFSGRLKRRPHVFIAEFIPFLVEALNKQTGR